MTDQQRFDTVAALGNPLIRTPALDRLCGEGTSFTRCYTPSPVCMAARFATLTGLPPHRTGVTDNVEAPRPSSPALTEQLQRLGYQTHAIGKMHLVPGTPPLWGLDSREFSEEGEETNQPDDFRSFLRDSGFEHVDDPHGVRSEMYYIPQPSQLPTRLHHTTWVADRSIEFFNRRDRSRPFFLFAGFIKPHPPFEAPTPWNKLYRGEEMPAPLRPSGFELTLNYWNLAQNRYKHRDRGHDEFLVRAMRAAYYGSISFIDFNIGRILSALSDEIDETLIVFCSDHGEYLGDFGAYGKRGMHDVSARVPLIVRWPEQFAPGRTCDAPATLLDLWPTCLTAAGHPSPFACTEGVSLSDLAAGKVDREIVFSQFQQAGFGLHMAAARWGKYIYSEPDQAEWYFDLESDPTETTDRSDDPSLDLRVSTLRRALIDRYRRDGYLEPLDGHHWRPRPKRTVPDNPEFGLLYQDAPELSARISQLGPAYARPIVESHGSLLRPHPSAVPPGRQASAAMTEKCHVV